MSNKTKKILCVILTSIMCLMMASCIFAAPPSVDKIWNDGSAAPEEVTTLGNKIVGTIQVIGTIAAVVILIVIGIMYMVSGAQGKAQIKERAVPFIIGAVIVLCGSLILTIVQNIGDDVLQ